MTEKETNSLVRLEADQVATTSIPSNAPLADSGQWVVDLIGGYSPDTGEEEGAFSFAKHEPPTPPYDDPRYWLERALAQAEEGNRNNTALWLAGQLLDNIVQFDPERRAECLEIMKEYAREVNE